ncbi:hypothetical protein AB205_0133180 [Aquarana catesbeiana]|uniref:Uncharacterized protein n=1 Tax=Aquarana catesbeiana TaxID=8400 RepID=A0A2G9SDI6_AQUCT|nr:hypothetical protein AB205_0133180 [Aquarana catesbeiana]
MEQVAESGIIVDILKSLILTSAALEYDRCESTCGQRNKEEHSSHKNTRHSSFMEDAVDSDVKGNSDRKK